MPFIAPLACPFRCLALSLSLSARAPPHLSPSPHTHEHPSTCLRASRTPRASLPLCPLVCPLRFFGWVLPFRPFSRTHQCEGAGAAAPLLPLPLFLPRVSPSPGRVCRGQLPETGPLRHSSCSSRLCRCVSRGRWQSGKAQGRYVWAGRRGRTRAEREQARAAAAPSSRLPLLFLLVSL